MHTVFLDLDDTLLDVKGSYDQSRKEVYNLLQKKYPHKVTSNYKAFRAHTIKQNNFYRYKKINAKIRFSQSLIDAALKDIPYLDKKTKKDIDQIGLQCFSRIPLLKEGVARHLRMFKQKHGSNVRLIIFTQGDKTWQMKKVNALPLPVKCLFERTIVTKEKNTAAYKQLLKQTGITHPNQATMIGDKEGADVAPALRAGMNAYHIPVYTMDFEGLNQKLQEIHGERYHRTTSLQKCFNHINKRLSNKITHKTKKRFRLK